MSVFRITLLLVFSVLLLFAQTDRGTITGTVADQGGAVIAGAPLTLVNTNTGTQYAAATSETGNYTFGQLPVGTYELRITVAGFKTFVRANLGVQVAQTIREDIILEVGTSTESVTVTAEASLLRTENAELATNVTMSRLNALPILGVGAQTASSHGIRNPLAASQIQPGVRFVANSIVRVNGAPNNTMGVRLDGQDITNNTAGAAFQAQVQPSLEAVEEVAIQTSNYAAEYGQAGGGLFNYSTRSGTNSWHGSAFDYFVNEALWAAQPFNKIRPVQRRNNYGGSIGGPIYIPKVYDGRDKSFFFFNYEDFRETINVNNVVTTVPIQPYRDGNFSSLVTARTIPGFPADGLGNQVLEGMIYDPNTERLAPNGARARLQFPGNVIPIGRFDPSSVKVQNLVPAPNFSTGLINNYNNAYLSARKTPIPALKLDHSLNDRMKASFYWSTNETSVQYCAQQCASLGLPLPIEPTRGTFIEAYTLRANFDYTVRPTVLLHFGAGALSNDFKDNSPVIGYDIQKELGISGGLGGTIGRFPQMSGLAGPQSRGGLVNIGPGGQSRSRFLKPTANLSASWVKDNHTYKFGGEMRIEGYPTGALTSMNGSFTFSGEQTSNSALQPIANALGGRFVGFPYASFLLGKVDQFTIGPPANGRGGRSFWGFFAQDTWKLTRKLTLDYGLRWDYFTYPREQYGRAPAFSAAAINQVAGNHPGGTIFEATCNCQFASNYKHAWGPRVGVAYQINSKTVLRAGIGVSYSISPGHLGQTGTGTGRTQTVNNPNYADDSMTLSGGIPIRPSWPDMRPDLFPSPGTTSGAPSVIDPNFGRPARMVQYSVSLQREFSRDLVVEGSFVANRGAWWMTGSLQQLNVLDPAFLKSRYGLDWERSAADRTILAAQINNAAAGPFRNRLPYAGFPATATVAQSLRPFPQFGNLTNQGAPQGRTWYDSFQLKVTKRYAYGLDFTMHYTFSKELQLGAESDTGGGQINDLLNRNTNKQLSSNSRPNWLVFATNYRLQNYFGNRVLNQLLGNWTIGAALQYGSGLPIQAPGNVSNNNGTTLGRGTWSTRVPGQPLYLVDDINCGCYDYGHTRVLNEAAWTDTPAGQFSPAAAYYNDYRYMRRPQELMSLARNFQIKERVTFMVRAEFNNIFNRTVVQTTNTSGFVNPSNTRGANFTTDPSTGGFTAGYGTINTTGNVGGQRQGTLVARLTF